MALLWYLTGTSNRKGYSVCYGESTLRGPWLRRLGAFSSCGWRGLPGLEGSWAYFEYAVAVNRQRHSSQLWFRAGAKQY